MPEGEQAQIEPTDPPGEPDLFDQEVVEDPDPLREMAAQAEEETPIVQEPPDLSEPQTDQQPDPTPMAVTQVEGDEGDEQVGSRAPAPEAVAADPDPSDPGPSTAASADSVAAEPAPADPVLSAPASTKRASAKPVSAKVVSAEPVAAPPDIEESSDPDNGARPVRQLPRVMAVANQKGGVGKTTTTVNLGAALADLGYRVLVIDLDPQGNATTGLGIDARNFSLSMYDVIMRDAPLEDCVEPTSVRNLFVAPATIDLAGVEIELVPAFSRELKLKKAIDRVVDDFDFILIDCPPSLGLITVNGLAAASEVLVPIQCEYYALEGLSQLLRNVHLVASNLNSTLEVSTIVLTMFDSRTRLAVDVASEVREHFAEQVCRIVIPRTVRLSEAPSFGQPITVFDPTSRGAVAYRELAKEVSNGAPKRAG